MRIELIVRPSGLPANGYSGERSDTVSVFVSFPDGVAREAQISVMSSDGAAETVVATREIGRGDLRNFANAILAITDKSQ